MNVAAVESTVRRPRFRRAPEPPPFRLTDADVEIIRHIARHRFLLSTHIAALVGRSLDRANDRLERLFHAAYIDRPRAQLDRFPTGSGAMVYALADRGARLLGDCDGLSLAHFEWSRKNRKAGRPFIEHQVEIVNFQMALQRAVRERSALRLISPEAMMTASQRAPQVARKLFALQAKIAHRGKVRERSAIPDLVFGLAPAAASRRNFIVEIDRGRMPV